MIGIYEIVNLADGKASAYIGSSQDVEYRWGQHRSALRGDRHPNAHLQSAWNKYGEDAFVFSVLEEVKRGMLLVVEQEYLDDYFDRGHCYNLARCAEAPARGCKLSEEHKRLISDKKRGRVLSEETKCRMSAAKMGHEVSEETRCKISASAAGGALGKPYPAFRNRETGEVIPAGVNLLAMCREHGLYPNTMDRVKHGRRKSYRGWVLA